jgi:hypothetical protein
MKGGEFVEGVLARSVQVFLQLGYCGVGAHGVFGFKLLDSYLWGLG